MSAQDFLVEIGTEELPPKALQKLSLEFADLFRAKLTDSDLADGAHIKAFAAPRRLALLVGGIPGHTPKKELLIWGPPAKVAFDANGAPTKAAENFAKKNGIALDRLRTENDNGTDKLVHRASAGGEAVIDLLAGFVTHALKNLSIPKRMRWGARRDEFVRPVQWVVMLFGDTVVDAEILGIKAGRETRGHRFHCNRSIALQKPADYQLTLENEAYVIADFSERRGRIRAQVEAAGKQRGGLAVIDEDLLDEVTALVEWPVALSGSFEERFLKVPQEALISSMKGHQKYFHVVDAGGKLLPHFITVANIESKDPAKVIDGNERVIRPRLSDAAFFYETDLKTPLAQFREKLKTVVFQEKLGTVFDKTTRIAGLAQFIAGQIGGNVEWAQRAGELSKADLVSNMVGEFDEMQGIAGGYYARQEGAAAEIADAIREHYLPRFADDELPAGKTGIAVALADRLDTLVGIFGIGQPPTGSKDPFALRRAVLGALRMIVDKGFDLDLRDCLRQAQAQYPQLAGQHDLADNVLGYMIERFRAWYEDEAIPAEVFLAVSAKNLSRPLDINQRVHAVHRFSLLPEAQALAAANKRVSNILAKQAGAAALPALQSALLSEPAEQALAQQLQTLEQKVKPLFAARQYREGLEQLAGLRAAIDAFFDDVMVMTDDEAVRNNRLALLSQLRNLFLEVADISLLAPAGK